MIMTNRVIFHLSSVSFKLSTSGRGETTRSTIPKNKTYAKSQKDQIPLNPLDHSKPNPLQRWCEYFLIP